MKCPACGGARTSVTNSRSARSPAVAVREDLILALEDLAGQAWVSRRRRCAGCGATFGTVEVTADVLDGLMRGGDRPASLRRVLRDLEGELPEGGPFAVAYALTSAAAAAGARRLAVLLGELHAALALRRSIEAHAARLREKSQ